MFNSISRDNVSNIIRNKLDSLVNKYPSFIYRDSLIEDIIEESNYMEYGIRRIGKIIDNKLEGIIIDKMLNDEELIINNLRKCQNI